MPKEKKRIVKAAKLPPYKKGAALAPPGPSSNWRKFQQYMGTSQTDAHVQETITAERMAKLQKNSLPPPASSKASRKAEDFIGEVRETYREAVDTVLAPPDTSGDFETDPESIKYFQMMIRGELEESLSEKQRRPGKYIAIDCEMVGVGPGAVESSLARVSVVNYFGHVLLDAFVKQRERVTDYRTQWSGIRPENMVAARDFTEVQAEVAELLKDRILIGHAVFNDCQALLLSHSRLATRDTQQLAGKYKLTRSKFPALRSLVQDFLHVQIQSGEHSSVTDARATMAIFRMHRKKFESGFGLLVGDPRKKGNHGPDEQDDEEHAVPGSGRKGVSSGLSVIVKRKGVPESSEGKDWWSTLS